MNNFFEVGENINNGFTSDAEMGLFFLKLGVLSVMVCSALTFMCLCMLPNNLCRPENNPNEDYIPLDSNDDDRNKVP